LTDVRAAMRFLKDGRRKPNLMAECRDAVPPNPRMRIARTPVPA